MYFQTKLTICYTHNTCQRNNQAPNNWTCLHAHTDAVTVNIEQANVKMDSLESVSVTVVVGGR